LNVAQNLVDLLWAVAGLDTPVGGPLMVQRTACPRQTAPNCALHAALLCRALYLQGDVGSITAAAVAKFRVALGRILVQAGGMFPTLQQLLKLPWPESTSSEMPVNQKSQQPTRHFRGSFNSPNSVTPIVGKKLEYALGRRLVDGASKQGKPCRAPSTSNMTVWHILRTRGGKRAIRRMEATRMRGLPPKGQGKAKSWVSAIGDEPMGRCRSQPNGYSKRTWDCSPVQYQRCTRPARCASSTTAVRPSAVLGNNNVSSPAMLTTSPWCRRPVHPVLRYRVEAKRGPGYPPFRSGCQQLPCTAAPVKR